MPKVTEEYREARRHEIAQAALRCFARTGFDGTSMADIIQESGLSAGAIYGHYKSKNELIQMAVGDLLARRTADFQKALQSEVLEPPGVLVGRFLHGIRAEIGETTVLVQLWASASNDPELRRMAAGIAGTIGGIFTRYLTAWYAQDGLDADEASARAVREAPVCIGLAQGYIVQSALFDGFDGEGYIAAIADVFVR
ncbi:MAG: TetR/AcrR family transcriptional regulator [Leifsonia sp.]